MAQAAEMVTDRQRRTLPARQALAQQFSSPEQKSEFYRSLGKRSAESRIVLSGDEAAALVDAYALLGRIAERARMKLGDAPNEAA
jgi:hypothetical protein